MTALKMSPVLTLLGIFLNPYQLPNKEYLITIFEICPLSYYRLISEHFGENRVILLQTVAR